MVGDVMGKGAEAASVTSLARHSMRTTALRARHPATMLNLLNEALLKESSEQPFATIAVFRMFNVQ